MGDGGQAGGIQFLCQRIQLLVVGHQLLGDTADENLIGNAPEHDGRMIVVLDDQLLHLLDAVLMGRGVLAHDGNEGDLGPDGKAQLVTGIIEVLRMLIVSQTNGICS